MIRLEGERGLERGQIVSHNTWTALRSEDHHKNNDDFKNEDHSKNKDDPKIEDGQKINLRMKRSEKDGLNKDALAHRVKIQYT